MKTLFKVWSILILIANVVSVVVLILSYIGLGALYAESPNDTAVADAAAFAILITTIPAVICTVMAFISAISGLKGDYDKCEKYSKVLLVISIIDLVCCIFIKRSVGPSIFRTIFYGGYVSLAKKMD